MARTVGEGYSVAQAVDTQRPATTGNLVNREMPFFCPMKAPAMVDLPLVESCKDELMALNRCIDLSGLSNETICDALGLNPGHFSRVRRGRAHFPARKRIALMTLCGNLLPLQYEALKLSCAVQRVSQEEVIRRLERELAEARSRSAAA